jgi:MFS family permease
MANFVISALGLTVIVRVDELGGGPTTAGLVMSAFGIGALSGSAVAAPIQRRLGGRTIVIVVSTVQALMWALAAAAPNPLLLALTIGIGSAVVPWINVMLGRYRYALAPDELQGRVMSAFRVLAWGAIPLGAMAGGLSLEAAGAVKTLLGLSLIMALLTIVAAALPSLRIDPLAGHDTPSPPPPGAADGSAHDPDEPELDEPDDDDIDLDDIDLDDIDSSVGLTVRLTGTVAGDITVHRDDDLAGGDDPDGPGEST